MFIRVYKNLTAKKLSCEGKTADIIFFDLHRRMAVSVQSYSSIRMAEKLAKSLGIEAFFNADSRIGVSEKMEVDVPDTA